MNYQRIVAVCVVGLVLCGIGEGAVNAQGQPFVFKDVAAAHGLHDALRGMMGHAAAWGDVDGDGRLDLFVGTFADRPVQDYIDGGAEGPVANRLLVQQPDGRFVRSAQPGLAHLGRASGVVLADFDNDGLPDLYVSNNGRLGKDNLLYHNGGGGRFDDVTAKAGAPMNLPETSRSVAVLDYDGDGLLDLLVLATFNKGRTLLFRNLGGMKFAVSDAIPDDVFGLGAAVGDITGNGWPDIMVGGSNRLFVNLGNGRFREARELNLDWGASVESDSPSCGVALGDFDRDGKLDLLIGHHFKRPWTDAKPIRLFRNLGSTPGSVRFEEVTDKVGIVPYPMKTPHVEIRDFDNDGWPDLYTAVVTMSDGSVHPAIYRNLGAKPGQLPRFEETAFVHRRDFPTADDLAPGQRTAAFYDKLVANHKVMYFAPGPSADFDHDGRLDLFLCSWWPKMPSMLLKNETPGGHWLAVQVVGKAGVNRMGIGSTVRAYLPRRAGEPAALLAGEAIEMGYGFCSAQPAVAHLGLAEHTRCDVVVTLPGGKGQIVRRNVEADQRLVIQQ